MTLRGRLDVLERSAPSLKRRPAGMNGAAFVQYVLRDLMSELTVGDHDEPTQEWTKAMKEWTDLFSHDELNVLRSALLEGEAERADKQIRPASGVIRLGSRRAGKGCE